MMIIKLNFVLTQILLDYFAGEAVGLFLSGAVLQEHFAILYVAIACLGIPLHDLSERNLLLFVFSC